MITDIRDQLLRDEGMRLRPYRDTQGHLTIGAGRNLDAVGVSLDEAHLLLDNDIDRSRTAVLVRFPWATQLDDARHGVLLNMAFNMGVDRLAGFNLMLAAMRDGDWEGAARELLDSKYAEQVHLRAQRLARQLVTGEWQ